MKRDIKYIIKKVIIGVLLFLIISFIKSNDIFAISTTSYTVNSSSFTRPTSTNWYLEPNIISIFNEFKTATNQNIVFDDYQYVVVYVRNVASNNASTNYHYYFCNKVPTGSYSSFYVNNGICYAIDLDYRTSLYRAYKFTTSGNERVLNNGETSIYASNVFSGTAHTLNFEPYLATTYMKLEYLNSSYGVISSVDCIDNTDNYCEFTINNNTGSFIKITYYLDELGLNNIDILNNTTYQLSTNIIGSNLYTRLQYINYWYYFNGSTSNIDSELIPPSKVSILYNNNDFTYNSNFKVEHEYQSARMYQLSLIFNTNNSSYTKIYVPYDFNFQNVTSSDGTVTPPTNQTEIDQGQIQINQNNTIIEQNDATNQKLDDINNSINNDNINGASSQASSFFSNFNNNDHGLSGIITIPLNLITSITSTTCQQLSLTLPFVNQTFNLPCMTAIYHQYFPTFLSLYQTITFGIVAYWVAVQIFALVKGFKEPDDDRIEVVDL